MIHTHIFNDISDLWDHQSHSDNMALKLARDTFIIAAVGSPEALFSPFDYLSRHSLEDFKS